MDYIIDYYIGGKIESEIADLVDVTEEEVKYILSEKNKTDIEREYGSDKWKKIVAQKAQNRKALRAALRQDFLTMGSEELTRIINSFLSSRVSIKEYCKQYHIPEDLFTIYLLNESFLKSKLGETMGVKSFHSLIASIQEIHILDNISILGMEDLNYKKMLLELGPLYLDGLYKPKEFIELAKINETIFNLLFQNKEAIQKVGRSDLYDKFQEHAEQVAQIRKNGNLKEGHVWIKEANIRRLILPNIYSIEQKQFELLGILVSYYENNGNVEMVKKQKKKPRTKITYALEHLIEFKDILQANIWSQIERIYQSQNVAPVSTAIKKTPEKENSQKKKFTVADIQFENNKTQKEKSLQQEVELKKQFLRKVAVEGDIRPYWICGQLAVYHFSYQETANKLGITEEEVTYSNELYMKSLCTTSSGEILPFNCSYEILLFAASLKPEFQISNKLRA